MKELENISVGINTNYYRAFQEVDTLLTSYKKIKDRDCLVLFLTDGNANTESPNELPFYRYLKEKYQYLIVNAVQYEMGEQVNSELKRVSDNQFIANKNNLEFILLDALCNPIEYEKFSISNFINTEYFAVDGPKTIEVADGDVVFNKENQQIIWNISNLKSGYNTEMKVRIKLIKQFLDIDSLYEVVTKQKFESKLDNIVEDFETTESPKVINKYNVIYDGNSLEDCLVSDVPATTSQFVFDKVKVSDKVPKCDGYQFKGWKIVDYENRKINDDYFVMPEDDVLLRATWAKIRVNKYVNGKVYKIPTFYNYMSERAVLDDRASEFVSNSAGINFTATATNTNGNGIYEFSSTKDSEYPIYYYRGRVDNNVNFAGFCWKIIRTTDTGGVKMIYNGTPNDGKCNITTGESTVVAKSSYNGYDSMPSAVGYMYEDKGAAQKSSIGNAAYKYGNNVIWNGSYYTLTSTFSSSSYLTDKTTIGRRYHYTCFSDGTTCNTVYYIFKSDTPLLYIPLSSGTKIENVLANMYTNRTNSSMKDVVDTWYQNNLTSYSNMIEDTVYCNDRSATTNGWTKDGNANLDLVFGARNRFYFNSQKPNLTCSAKNDSFTVSDGIGNGLLTYPIGLVTADEAVLAGMTAKVNSSSNSYLYNNQSFWTMSPNFFGTFALSFFVDSSGKLYQNSTKTSFGVRPVIALNKNVIINEGDGSEDNPFTVTMNVQ